MRIAAYKFYDEYGFVIVLVGELNKYFTDMNFSINLFDHYEADLQDDIMEDPESPWTEEEEQSIHYYCEDKRSEESLVTHLRKWVLSTDKISKLTGSHILESLEFDVPELRYAKEVSVGNKTATGPDLSIPNTFSISPHTEVEGPEVASVSFSIRGLSDKVTIQFEELDLYMQEKVKAIVQEKLKNRSNVTYWT